MNRLILVVILSLGWLSITHAQFTQDIDPKKAVDGQYVRVMRLQDGSRAIFQRSPSNDVLEKRTFSPAGVLTMLTIYRMDKKGNPMSCKIFDGLKQELFKARYGYDRQSGRLVEEQLFDSRVKRCDPVTQEEMPVRRFIYTYDENGKQNKPISIVLRPGKRAEDVYAAPSALEKNPFHDVPRELTPQRR